MLNKYQVLLREKRVVEVWGQQEAWVPEPNPLLAVALGKSQTLRVSISLFIKVG